MVDPNPNSPLNAANPLAQAAPSPPAAPENPLQSELLEKLRDVQAADPVSWWPPAPGWWVIAALGLAAVFFLFRYFQKRTARRQYRVEATQRLVEIWNHWRTEGDPRIYSTEVSALIRQVAIHVEGRDRVARLTGKAFVDSVGALSSSPFSEDTTRLLADSAYLPDATLAHPNSAGGISIERVHAEIESWLSGVAEHRDA